MPPSTRDAEARAIIEAFDLPADLELWPGQPLTTALIADTFQVFLEGDRERITDERDLPLGVSKARGIPHLPAGEPWPGGMYFEAQLALAELAAHGLWDFLPAEGLLTLFFDPSAGPHLGESQAASAVLHPTDGLELTQRPDPSALPYGGEYYESHFFEWAYRIRFTPRFSLGFGETVPAPLFEALEAGLGIERSDEAHGAVGGEPVTYQDEDEDTLFAPDDHDWSEGPPEHDGDRFLLFQDDFGEGHAHFWIECADLARGDVSTILTTYSGT